MKKGKTKTIMLSVLIILAAGLLVFSLAARTTRDKPESDGSGYATNASALEVSDGGDIFTAPAGLNAGSSGVPEEIGEYGRLCAGDYDTIVPDGSYTNKSFGYICSPSMAYVQIRHETQGWDSYWHTDRMMFSASNNDGWYYFRGYNPTPKGDYSYESRICLDTIKPQVQVFVNGKSAADGSRTNSAGAVISVSGSDDLSGIESYWYKINNGPYCQCDSGAAFTAEGEYAFYVKDRAGNVSDAVTVTKDATAPALSAYDGSVKIGDRAHTNASSIRFEASDELSGASAIYIFRPDSSILLGLTEIYSLYVSLPVTLSALEGEYKYYAKDKAGNKSATYSFTVDRTYPTAQIYSGTAAVPNNYYSTASYIRFAARDENGVTCYMKRNGFDYGVYPSGAEITADGVYSFYAVDPAGNKTPEYKITLDRTAPVGTLYAGSAIVPSGRITNAAYVTYRAMDNTELYASYVRTPNAANYVRFKDGTQFTADGTYYFYSEDKIGNVSGIASVTLDRTKPVVAVYADGGEIVSGAYTNQNYVGFSASDAGGGIAAKYVKRPGAGAYTPYTEGTRLSGEGAYFFYAVDAAGNRSDVCAVTVDRAAKPLTVVGLTEDGITDDKRVTGDASLMWEDRNPDAYAPIVTVTVNGRIYNKGGVIRTIDGGAYVIESVDAVGNVWTDLFTAERTDVLNGTLNKEYWETKDGDGDTYSFAAYESALTFAKEREAALVKTGTWIGSVWDGGIAIDAADGVNAVNGTYYVYKKSGENGVWVAYFSVERLNAVIAEYAAASVTAYYWWQKEPATPAPFENLYELRDGRVFIGNSVTLADHANYLIDGEPYIGLTYSVHGVHALTVYDDFGNGYEYALIIVRAAPEVLYGLSGGVWNTAVNERRYAMKEAVTLRIADGLGDAFAMCVVRNGAGETIAIIGLGEEYVIAQSGRYTVQAVNHYGMSAEILFTLSLEYPAVIFGENTNGKRLEIGVRPSADSDANLGSVRIFRSADDGLTWLELDADDYGRAVNAERSFYEFNRSGVYRVVVEDNFRSGIDAVTAVAEYAKPAPEGTLDGVSDGGYTGGTVRFTWTDEASARLTRDGNRAAYLSGTEITDEGEYGLEFADEDGHSRAYMFTIDRTAPSGELSGAENGCLTNKPVTLEFEDYGAVGALYRNGVLVGEYGSGTAVTEDGEYKITLTDKAGNASEYIFAIDGVKPEAVLYGVENGGRTGGGVVLKNPSEQCGVRAYKDGAEFGYNFGETLDKEGGYRIVLTDNAGNVTEYGFDITYAVNAAGTVVVIIIIVTVLGGALLVCLMRRRKAFKKK